MSLRESLTIEIFEKSYFYLKDLKKIAKELGIQVGTLRENEIEEHIRNYLLGNKENQSLPKSIPNRVDKKIRDILKPEVYVTNYVDDKHTKNFLLNQIYELSNLKVKSGQWYWLNDYRKKQIQKNIKITYKDLINHLFSLMKTEGKLPKIPSTK